MGFKEELKSFFKNSFRIPQNMEENKGRDESIVFENIRRLRQYGHTPAPFLINNELDFFTEFEYESESLRGNQIRYIKEKIEILAPTQALESFMAFGIVTSAGKLEELVEGLISLNDMAWKKVDWRQLMRAVGRIEIYPNTIFVD
jgi:hypothetical protein